MLKIMTQLTISNDVYNGNPSDLADEDFENTINSIVTLKYSNKQHTKYIYHLQPHIHIYFTITEKKFYRLELKKGLSINYLHLMRSLLHSIRVQEL